ncbi:MAG TPA: hypothetical protein VLM89_04905 [Phycisphaerae bacterium]|nr:hypothetical protein [Phycisphaerae bacterium]
MRTFADNALRYGRDVYGPKHTPLFVDGLNVDTHEPAVWELPEQYVESWKMPSRWIMCNLASQQNFFRTLIALSQLTGNPQYKRAAVDAMRYGFDHLRHPCGLLYWGGHTAWDLETDQPVGEGRTDGVAGKHEFKRNYPFYEFLWEIDPKLTREFIESFWSNHVLDFSTLDFNRHGKYNPVPADPWGHAYVGGPIPFIGKGLTFTHTGSDLFYAAAMLSVLGDDERPLVWAKRLAGRYHEACDPRTGLGADNFSEEQTRRFVQQFGPEFGERLTEATFTSVYGARYRFMAVCQLKLAERLGSKGREFGQWAVKDLTAYARHAYDPGDNTFWATLIDGTKLSPADRKRGGYVREDWLAKRKPDSHLFWAYVSAYKLSGDRLMWDMTRNLARGFQLGEFGSEPGASGRPNMDTSASDPLLILALLDLHATTKERAFLDLARKVGDNLLAGQFHHGFFVADKDHLFCKLDTITPLALIYLDVALQGTAAQLPFYCGSEGFFHCSFEGQGRTYDRSAIYTRLRK